MCSRFGDENHLDEVPMFGTQKSRLRGWTSNLDSEWLICPKRIDLVACWLSSSEQRSNGAPKVSP